MDSRLMIKYLVIFLAGIGAGAAGYFIFGWNDAFGPPSSQAIEAIPVKFGGLNANDQWLSTSTTYLTPLNGVWSNRKYAVLIFVPPESGMPTGSNQSSEVDLETKSSDLVQPISISSGDFGSDGKQIAVKFIDEGVIVNQAYRPSQETTLKSH